MFHVSLTFSFTFSAWQGVIVPHVNTKAEAEMVVAASKFKNEVHRYAHFRASPFRSHLKTVCAMLVGVSDGPAWYVCIAARFRCG